MEALSVSKEKHTKKKIVSLKPYQAENNQEQTLVKRLS